MQYNFLIVRFSGVSRDKLFKMLKKTGIWNKKDFAFYLAPSMECQGQTWRGGHFELLTWLFPKMRSADVGGTGTSIQRGGHGGSVKCQNSNLQQLFPVNYALEFGEHSTKQPHTKFQTQILMCGIPLKFTTYTACYKSSTCQPSLVLLCKHIGRYWP
jgi:hypothetical protein